MKLVAFDPASLRNIGWATCTHEPNNFLYDTGTFVMPNTPKRWQVLSIMYEAVDKLLVEEKPDMVVIEQTSSFRSKKAAFVGGQVSECMGAIKASVGKQKLNLSLVYPTSIKKTVAGHGRATKPILKNAVVRILSDLTGAKPTFSSDHACDAMASILHYLIKKGDLTIEEENNEQVN